MKEKFVFGLDIGTRSIVGTVGYKQGDKLRPAAAIHTPSNF